MATTPVKPVVKPAWIGPTKPATIRRIFDTLAAHIDPKGELEYGSLFQLLVAVVLSAQTTDVAVNAGTRKLFPVAGTPEAILALGEHGLKPFIKHIGLYNAKAKNVIALCDQLITKHGGEVPADRDALEALPGVGHKTASVVLNIGFGQPCIAVDTHVQRLSNRLGIAATTQPVQTERVLLARVPKKHLLHAHHYLILHGRYTCKARKPECWRCPITKHCPYPDKTPTQA